MSDHLIHALPAVRRSLALLFTSILRHGYMPKPLRNCILVPISKANKDSSNSDNYRPISLAPTLSKALEWCILLLFFLHLWASIRFQQRCPQHSARARLKMSYRGTCMKVHLCLRVFLMRPKLLILLITRLFLTDYWKENSPCT